LTGGNGLLGYSFEKYGITVYAHGDLVQAVATTNSVIGGVNGIELGTPVSEIVRGLGQVYSQGTVEGYPGVVYAGSGIAFGIDHNAVAAILVFRPATALPNQPAPTASPAAPVTSHAAPAGQPASAAQPSATAQPAAAPQAPAAQVAVAPPTAHPATAGSASRLPDVSNLRAYTSGTHFLSLAGYLRYLVHDTSKKWMTTEDTDKLMHQAGSADTP
jgi:hypothetical protein